MENQETNNSDGKSCYSPTTNFPPTRTGTCPPNANPFGTVPRTTVSSVPRVAESGFVRSPALKLGILSGGGGGVVLRPSLLSAGAKDKDAIDEPNSNGGTNASPSVDPEAEEPNGVEEQLEKVNGDGSSTSSSESSESGSGTVNDVTNIAKESDTPTRAETAVDLESTTAKPDSETKAEVQVQKEPSLAIPEVPASTPTFIFGSNLGERVENAPTFGSGFTDGAGSTPALTFATASAGVSSSPAPTTSGTESGWKRYEEERSVNKRKWEDTAPSTGEEEESNVLQTSCRLFTFDTTTSSWVERGRGLLRLNDRQAEALTSRLVMRTQGSLRVILNTPVFHGMMTTKASEKSVKITGVDEDGEVKVYLIQCSPSDAETLHSALEWRVRSLAPPSPQTEKVTIHSSHFHVSPKKKRSE